MVMFSKNLKYYRLKNSMTKKDLADRSNLTPMAITYYENGQRKPTMETLHALASALGVRVSDFLTVRNDNLNFSHGEFRKQSSLGVAQQEFVQESVEEYFSRFYTAVELLGGDVLPDNPACHSIPLSGNAERDASALRHHLNLSSEGPIDNLIEILENKGILVYLCDIDCGKFSGMNGFVNERPYIIINGTMSTERNRSTIVHELAHLMFIWPDEMTEKDAEALATAISGAFLIPAHDLVRELGIQRRAVTNDMQLVCREYGISMYLLVKRARLSGIISENAERTFYIQASTMGWQKKEPSRIAPERPMLFEQLVYRAVNEEDISIQRGAELLQEPFSKVAQHCCFEED